MIHRVLVTAVVVSAFCFTGCAPTVTRGARALLPAQTGDAQNVWVYLDTNSEEKSGVYRCRDVGEQVTCVKAKLVSQ